MDRQELTTSEVTKSHIKAFEGCRLTAYRDMAGVLTIGYGHTIGVRAGDVISKYQANQYFNSEIAAIEREILKLPIAELLNQNKFDALVSWCYNLGVHRLTHGSDGKPTTLYRKILAKAPDGEIQAQFKRWVYAGGKIAPGLQRRREWEAKLWGTAVKDA